MHLTHPGCLPSKDISPSSCPRPRPCLQTEGCNSGSPATACDPTFQYCLPSGSCTVFDGAFAPIDLAVSVTGPDDPRGRRVIVLSWAIYTSWDKNPYVMDKGFRMFLTHRSSTGVQTRLIDNLHLIWGIPSGMALTKQAQTAPPYKTIYVRPRPLLRLHLCCCGCSCYCCLCCCSLLTQHLLLLVLLLLLPLLLLLLLPSRGDADAYTAP